ncbi:MULTISPECIES: hypothetical protein [Salinibaculum]|uniref:hypothetical protein n=1 Tax=Salinibaculum TaxID=2732368 RepID=UPI0030CDF734
MNDERERRYEALLEATGENTKSKALDTAATYYTRMAGGTDAVPTGKIKDLIELAEEQGSVTPAEIADVLDTDELPLQFETEWSVGTQK